MTPKLVVLSSPSGAGKTTLATSLLARRPDVGRSVSATTRAPRPGEADGRDYHFLGAEEFARREVAGEFLESAAYGGNRYGTLRAEVERLHREGRHALLVIEVAGARQVRARFPGAVLVFVLPPSGPELVRRLRSRMTEDGATLRRRLDAADLELAAVGEYDYVVVNDELDRAVDEVGWVLDGDTRRLTRPDALGGAADQLRREVRAELERGAAEPSGPRDLKKEKP